jgi:NAD(P) transhydrogenase
MVDNLMRDFDLLIIGSGPAGIQAAYRAAQENKRVAVVEKNSCLGGVCIHTGTIPSKTLRQAVLDVSGFHQYRVYGEGSLQPKPISMKQLMVRCHEVIAKEVGFQEALMRSRGVKVIDGAASFHDPHTIRVLRNNGDETLHTADKFIIAVGSEPGHDADIPFEDHRILDSDQVLDLEETPESLIVIGAGVIGSEYASIFSLLETKVTLIDQARHVLSFVDRALFQELEDAMTQRGVNIVCGQAVTDIRVPVTGDVEVTLADDSVYKADALLYCRGRVGAVQHLNLDAAGIEADNRGRIWVDENYRTKVPHIYATGDVIGFPSLASASREQGRIAAGNALEFKVRPMASEIPFGVYTIPEIAMIGPTEEQARRAGTDIVVGEARYGQTARGQIIGDVSGLLKLVARRDDGKLLSVHIIGTNASELIHIGQMAIFYGASYEYFIKSVMNYPTLSRAYKVAAYDLLDHMTEGQ